MRTLTLERSQINTTENASLRQRLTAFDLETACQHLKIASSDVRGAMQKSQRQYAIPATVQGDPLFVDEALKFPLSLTSTLQTAALYQRLDWEKPLDRHLAVGEFFAQYVKALVEYSVPLLYGKYIALDLSSDNVIVAVAQGTPVGIQLRSLQPTYSKHFGLILLEQNLKPLVEQLSAISGEKPEIFWDYATESILDTILNMPVSARQRYKAQQALLFDELDAEGRLFDVSTCDTDDNFSGSGIIFLKKKCCKSYKKGDRCRSCPAFGKKR